MPPERKRPTREKRKTPPPKIEQETALLQFFSLTEASRFHPDDNHDAKLELEKEGIFAVFDGMGGLESASRASQLVRDKVTEFLQTAGSIDETVLAQAIQAAHEVVFAENKQRKHEDRMGTTASLIHLIRKDNGQTELCVAQSCDSPVFIVRPDGSMDEVMPYRWSTEEEEKYKVQLIKIHLRDSLSTPPEARYYRQVRNVLNGYVGDTNNGCKVKTNRVTLETDTRILVMTDGISSNLLKQEMEEILKVTPNLKAAARLLISAARQHSRANTMLSKVDDMTVIIVKT